jgi:glycosyltransferase involved in cell wall biosynthesis
MRGNDKEPTGNILTVTVVIPCHNHADMIGDAIDSVVSQDYRPINIVVVDDGSEDKPESVISQKAEDHQDDTELEIVSIKNPEPTGPSAARNKAIKHMWEQSDVFMMLDADDRYLDGKISKSVEKYLESPEHIGIVYTDAIIKNEKKGTSIHEFRAPFSKDALERECIISNTPLISKDALQRAGLYDEEMRTCEDWDLWLRITEFCVAVHIAEPLHVYSVTGKNSSDVVAPEVWQSNWSKIQQKIVQRRHVDT